MRASSTARLVPLMALALAGCQPGEDKPEGLNGEWLGINFQCPVGVLHQERVAIVEEDGEIVATKLTGDDCVPAGEITFQGSRDKITCISGLPDDPVRGSYEDSIRSQQENGFSVCGVEFERVQPDAAPE
ncbi:MAG: Cyclin D1-binding domain-containing protein [Alcanivoracaceae bacterium]|nr:Cyclin D1-binding domain-containing protein [Alcanivoracaceae bacterium]